MLRSVLLIAALSASVPAAPIPIDRDAVSGARSDYNLSTRGDYRVFARSDADFAGAQIHESTRRDGRWSEPAPVAFSDPRWRDSDPWLAPDGRTLYFVSDRPTASRPHKRDLDLWRATRTAHGWSAPEHLGDTVNSTGYELGPEVHDGVLYFASTRAGGRGGLDLYAAPVHGTGFAAARALPAPLNSAASESDLTFSANGREAVFWRATGDRLVLHHARRTRDGWTAPAPLSDAANPGPMQITPAFTDDGRSLVFASDVAREGQPAGLFDLYAVAWPLR